MEKLCEDILNDSVRINIGNVGEANADIHQVAVVMDTESQKMPWLLQRLPGLMVEGQIIIFVSRIGAVDEISKTLKANDYECGTLHGEMMQQERDRVMREFKKNKYTILVATDIAARGLDIPEVKTVINYDNARDIDSHVHRIGRTGRAGQKGTAFTLVTQREEKFAGDLVRNFEGAGQFVPPELLELAMQHPHFQSRRAGGFSGGGGGGGKKRWNGGGSRGGRGGGRGGSQQRWTGREGIGSGSASRDNDDARVVPSKPSFQLPQQPQQPTGAVRFATSSQPYSTLSHHPPPSATTASLSSSSGVRFAASSQPYSTVSASIATAPASNTGASGGGGILFARSSQPYASVGSSSSSSSESRFTLTPSATRSTQEYDPSRLDDSERDDEKAKKKSRWQ